MNQDVIRIAKHYDWVRAARDGIALPPVHLQIDLTTRCNLRCSHCINHTVGRMDVPCGIDIERDTASRAIESFFKAGGSAVQITGGGEPTLHPAFSDIVRLCDDRHLKIGIVSNGVAWTKQHVDVANLATWIRLSIDAATRETWSIVHGVNQALFDSMEASTNRIRAALPRIGDKKLGMSFIISSDNWREIVEAAEFAKQHEFDYIRYSWKYGDDVNDEHAVYAEEARHLLAEAQNVEIDVYGTGCNRDEVLRSTCQDFDICGYHMLTTVLGADGWLYPCCSKKYETRCRMADANAVDLFDYWTSESWRRNAVHAICPRVDCRHACWMEQKNEAFEALFNHGQHEEFV